MYREWKIARGTRMRGLCFVGSACVYLRENAEFWLSNSKILYECAYVKDVFLYMYLLYLLHTYAANVPIDYHFRSRIHDLCKVLICLFCFFLIPCSADY